MGIIWDFDWGYGYSGSGNHYVISRSSNPLFSTGSNAGTRFFSRIMSDPHIKSLFKERWEWFKANKMDELEAYVKDYADIIADGLADDHARWGKRNGTSDPDANLNRLLEWLNARTAYIDNMVADW